MMGFEPIPRFSRERILSPLRLPFRHIGVWMFPLYEVPERDQVEIQEVPRAKDKA